MRLLVFAGHAHSAGVHNHNVITHFHAGREGGFVFSEHHARDAGGKPSKVFTIGIHHIPVALDLAFFRIV
jgi:hypothetical protein